MTTKEKIKDAFIALVIEKQTVKISVKDIVKEPKYQDVLSIIIMQIDNL